MYKLLNKKYLALAIVLSLGACASSANNQGLKPIDKITIGIKDKNMRALWIQADKAGNLPPLAQIPAPEKRVSQRQLVTTEKIETPKPIRPVIHKKVAVDIQPFSSGRIIQYHGDFQIIDNKLGVLIGKIKNSDKPLEFHYKLPDKSKSRMLRLKQKSVLQLSFLNDVQDTALQRRIVLSDKGNIAPFVYISEGSNKPYNKVIKEVGLIIEQQNKTESPYVKVTYKKETVVLKQGEYRRIGKGNNAVEVYLRASVAINQKKQVLREGQAYYVNLVIYRIN